MIVVTGVALKVVTFACNHSRLGGDNMSMLGAIEGLQQRGITSTVILPEKGDIEEKLRKNNVRYTIIRSSVFKKTSKFSILLTLLKYLSFIIKSKSDILHSNDVYCNKFMTISGKLFRKKTVCHVRFKVNDKIIDYYLSPQPDYVVFNSMFMEREFFHSCSGLKLNSKTTVIYNPLLTENYYKPHLRMSMRNQWKAEDQFVVCIVGNISEQKGHLEFVESAKNLLKFKDDFLFVVVGKDTSGDNKNLETVVNMVENYGLGDNFIFHGVAEDMGKVFAGVDLLLFPSHFESFGRVAVESLLAGVPVVASRVGGLIEILDGNPAAKLVDVGDVDGFVNAVLFMRDSDHGAGKNIILEQGKRIIEEKFSFNKSISDLLNIYRND